MPELTGANQYIQWVTTGGTVVLSTDYRTWDVEDSQGSVDKSAGADLRRTYLPTLTDGSIASTFLHDGGTINWTRLKAGTQGTLTWGEAGTATGMPKHTQPAFIDKSRMQSKYDDVEIWDISFKPMADRTDAAY
jgi:hypothetical protein